MFKLTCLCYNYFDYGNMCLPPFNDYMKDSFAVIIGEQDYYVVML